ncbi:kinetochore-associated protein NSL1 homolog [Neosynchiropus ocellatus]
MDPHPTEHIAGEPTRDCCVWVRSKRTVLEQVNEYKAILSTILDDQPNVEAETRGALLQELLANFEAAVLENVLVNGLTWNEAPDAEEEEVLDLEDQLSDAILETTSRRSTYPRQIRALVVDALKAERHLMRDPEPTHSPSVELEPDHDRVMKDLSAAAPDLAKRTVEVVKSLSTLRNQAFGLRHIVNMNPSSESLQIHEEVMGRPESPPPRTSCQPVRRAAEEAAMAGCYVAATGDGRGPDPGVCDDDRGPAGEGAVSTSEG